MSCTTVGVAVGGCLKTHSGVPGVGGERRLKNWELTEDEFLERHHQLKITTLQSNIRYYQNQLETLGPKQSKKREEAEWRLKISQDMLQRRLNEGISDGEKRSWREQYAGLVKKAISSGESVPDKVIDQERYQTEFQLARTNRERYEKGRHTSFANESAAVDDSMFEKRGYKVKRQDGKAMTAAQLLEIENSVDEIESVVGSLKTILSDVSPTLAHTNGKHPFLQTAVGLYSVGERTISIGTKRMFRKGNVPALAHELFGHCLDHEAGNRLGMSTRVSNKSVTKSWDATAISEYDHYNWGEAAEMYEDARRCMNSEMKVRGFLKPGSKPKADASDEEKDNYETVKLKLGHYYHRPREIWARLCEQYVSTKLREQGHDMTNLKSVEANYTRMIGYWPESDWKRLEPMVEKEINRRLNILRTDEKGLNRIREAPQFGRRVRKSVGKLPGLNEVVSVKSGYQRGDNKKLEIVQVESNKWAVYRTWYERGGNGHQAEQVSSSAEMTLEQAKVVAGNMLLTRARRDEDGYTVVD